MQESNKWKYLQNNKKNTSKSAIGTLPKILDNSKNIIPPTKCPYCFNKSILTTSSNSLVYCKKCKIFLSNQEKRNSHVNNKMNKKFSKEEDKKINAFSYTNQQNLMLNPLCDKCNDLFYNDTNKNKRIICNDFDSFLKKSILCKNCKIINEFKLKELFYKHNSFFRRERKRNVLLRLTLLFIFILIEMFIYTNKKLKKILLNNKLNVVLVYGKLPRFFYYNILDHMVFNFNSFDNKIIVDGLVYFLMRKNEPFMYYLYYKILRIIVNIIKNRIVIEYLVPGGLSQQFDEVVRVFENLSLSNTKINSTKKINTKK